MSSLAVLLCCLLHNRPSFTTPVGISSLESFVLATEKSLRDLSCVCQVGGIKECQVATVFLEVPVKGLYDLLVSGTHGLSGSLARDRNIFLGNRLYQ